MEAGDDDPAGRSQGRELPLIRGMESVVATVSGYHGTERFKLIKLITRTGAHYVGAMGRSTTHLICWQFEGKKYELARDFGTTIVSHRWFEDCLKEGKRLSEGPYMQSGQEAGAISCDVLDVFDTHSKRKSLLTRERNILSDQTSVANHTKSVEINARCSDVEYLNWSVSHLLNENSFPNSDTKIKGSKNVRKIRKGSNLDPKSGNKDLLGPFANGLGIWPEESSSFSSICSSSRQKRSLCEDSGNNVTGKPTRRSCRLAKSNASFDILNRSMLDCKRESRLRESNGRIENINSDFVDLDNVRNSITASTRRFTSENMPLDFNGSRIQGLEEVEGIGDMNKYPLIIDSSNNRTCNALSIHGTSSNNVHCEDIVKGIDSCVSGGNQDEQTKELSALGESAGVHTQEVSCVICWTDFCSTRGVLPCGHRFCYSCIEEWADCMASKGKVSTCPLCKTCFKSITKLDGSASPDQKIYSQTIPHSSSKVDVLMLLDSATDSFGDRSSESVCYECHNHEPEDLLVSCHLCQRQWVHTCCLDPPLVPWTCIHCRDLRMLYQRFR